MGTPSKITLATLAAWTVLAFSHVVGAHDDVDPPGPAAGDPLLLEVGEIGRYDDTLTLAHPVGTLGDGRGDNCAMRLWALNHSRDPVDVALVGVDRVVVDARTIEPGGQVTLHSHDFALLDAATDANTTPLRAVWGDGNEQPVASLLELARPDGCWAPTFPAPWDDPDRTVDVLPSNPRVECVDVDGRPVCRLQPVG